MNTRQTTALVTGANKGLGRETARRLAASGWQVFLGSRDRGRGEATARELAAEGVTVVVLPLDVTSQDSVDAAVRLVREHTDHLDVLVNNAGAPGNVAHPAEATAADLHAVFDVNVYGPVRMTQAFLPLLLASDHPRVVNVSSAAGSFAVVRDPDQAVSKMPELSYTASKAALNMLTVRYAQAIGEVKFNCMTPGEVANHKFTATDMNNHAGQLTVTEGSDPIIALATIGADGPTGTFIDRIGPVDW